MLMVIVEDSLGGGRLLMHRLWLPRIVPIFNSLLLEQYVLGRKRTGTQSGNDELMGPSAIIGYADDNEYPLSFNL
jgi:hypothetical protein